MSESTETVKVRVKCCKYQTFDFSDTDAQTNACGLLLNKKKLAL